MLSLGIGDWVQLSGMAGSQLGNWVTVSELEGRVPGARAYMERQNLLSGLGAAQTAGAGQALVNRAAANRAGVRPGDYQTAPGAPTRNADREAYAQGGQNFLVLGTALVGAIVVGKAALKWISKPKRRSRGRGRRRARARA